MREKEQEFQKLLIVAREKEQEFQKLLIVAQKLRDKLEHQHYPGSSPEDYDKFLDSLDKNPRFETWEEPK